MGSYVLKVDGSRVEAKPANGKAFKRDELYTLVGVSKLEWVYLKDAVLIFDEGVMIRFVPSARNVAATEYARENGRNKGIILYGDVLVADKADMG